MVFGDNIDVDKVYGVDNTDDNETSYWIIMLILAMMMLLLIPGENLDDDNGNIDKKSNNTDYSTNTISCTHLDIVHSFQYRVT